MAIDRTTGFEIIMEDEHYKCHDNAMYSFTYSNTIAAAGTTNFFINTGAGEPHIKFNVSTNGAGRARLLEGITTTANGTSVPVYNMHRDATESCAALFFHTPTWSTNSEVTLTAELIPGSSNPGQQFGSQARTHSEWILKTGTKYMVQIENLAGATITAILNGQFYEMSI